MNMIMGPRPTLGWLGYLMIGGSWRRFFALLVVFGFVSLFVVDEAQRVVTLHFAMPAPFPPPVTFVHTPDNSFLSPLDACSVEAASSNPDKKQKNRRVYVYLWKGTVTPADEWANWILQLPNVHVSNMELPKLIGAAELPSLKKAAIMGPWQKWLAARLAILWSYGGISMSFGSVMTKPLSVDVMGPHSGVLMEGENYLLDPTILGTPSHHPIISFLAKRLANSTISSTKRAKTLPGELLTEAVFEGCDIEKLSCLSDSDCDSFNLITEDKIFSLSNQQGKFQANPREVLIRYPEELYTFRDEARFIGYFKTNSLERFCPLTAGYLQRRPVNSDY